MHQAMHLADEWRGAAVAIVAHALADAPVPGAKTDFAAGALFDLAIGVLRDRLVLLIC